MDWNKKVAPKLSQMVALRSIEHVLKDSFSGWYRAYEVWNDQITSITVAGAAPDLNRFPI